MGLDDGASNPTHDERHDEMVRLLAGSGLPRVRLRGKDMAMFTYAIRGGDAVKIGKTQNVKQRLGQLQTSSPTKLELLYFFDQDYEREFHQALAPHRQSGEWFEWNEHTEAFLGQMVAERDGVSGREALKTSVLLA